VVDDLGRFFMPASVEFVGKNVEKALKKACEKLKITEDKLKYEVISFGSSGIFGLAGAKKAKISIKLEEVPKTTFSETSNTAEDNYDNSGKSSASEDLADTNDPESSDTSMPSALDEPLALGRDILQRIIDSLTTDATIDVVEDSDRVLFNVVGGNAAILIGKRGQTLEAIQSLVEKAVNKKNKNRIRIQIDIAGYLETRRENLEQLANRLAEKAKRIEKPISLGQMSAADRRIIHLALKDDPDVRTQSRGDGYLKKLVIFPKKNRRQNKQ
jgi:spoIIIJ-associated protein